jgi:hypothetical protein
MTRWLHYCPGPSTDEYEPSCPKGVLLQEDQDWEDVCAWCHEQAEAWMEMMTEGMDTRMTMRMSVN